MAADAVAIRPALPNDAAALAMLANALDCDQGGDGKVHSEATVLRAAFAAEPAVRFVVATQAAEPVGYAMFARFYNSDTAETGSYLNDLYVIPACAAPASAGACSPRSPPRRRKRAAASFGPGSTARTPAPAPSTRRSARATRTRGSSNSTARRSLSLRKGQGRRRGAGAHPRRRRIASLPWTSRRDPPNNREGASKRPCRRRR